MSAGMISGTTVMLDGGYTIAERRGVMKNQPSVVLNNGVEMPLLGLGLFRITNENGGFSQCIHDALEEGYRFFDTAEYYENEKESGGSVGIERPASGRILCHDQAYQ